MNVSSRYSRALGVFLVVVAAPSSASAESPPEPVCSPVAYFGEGGADGSPRLLPQNAPVIPFAIGGDEGRTESLDPLKLRRVGAGEPEGPWDLVVTERPPSVGMSYGLVEATLPPDLTEGNYAVTFVPRCKAGIDPKGRSFEAAYAVVGASPFPTSLGALSAVQAPSIDADPTTATPSFGYPRLRFDVTLKSTPELHAFRYVAHVVFVVGPADRIKQDDVAERGPYGRYELGLPTAPDGTLTARIGGNCKGTGPIYARVSGGVYGVDELPSVDVALGECTEADVAATGRYERNDRPPVIVKPRGCAISTKRSEDGFPLALLSTCALLAYASRRRLHRKGVASREPRPALRTVSAPLLSMHAKVTAMKRHDASSGPSCGPDAASDVRGSGER